LGVFSVKTLQTRLKRILDDRKKVQKQVDKSMKDLDEMGSLHDIKRPDFLTDENHDISNNEIQYALRDLYQSLLFDGEAPEHKSTVMPELEYDNLEKGLIENVYRIQHTTVGRALKRVIKKVEIIETKEKQSQSTFEPFELVISKMEEKL
jgi:hypothetical protein